MNYKRIYEEIVSNRKENPIPIEDYGEVHHILPKSLGGSNDEDNLVRLTAREHFICHLLLSEMYEFKTYEWYKMNHALMMMKCTSTNQNRYINSRLYEAKRKDFSIATSQNQAGEKNSQYNTVWVHHPTKQKSLRISLNDLEDYMDRGWLQGRIINWNRKVGIKVKKYYFDNGHQITDSRRRNCLKMFDLDLYSSKDRRALYTLLYKEYVEEDDSTVTIAKRYNSSDVVIRKLLIDIGIGTKDKGGKWT